MADLLTDTANIDKVLSDGAEKAAAIAMPILAEAKKAAGFL